MKPLLNLSLTKKITLAGIIIANVIILNKVLAINYIAFIPFVRISFGSIALIAFTSIGLGPIFGFICGALADVLGYFMFDASSFALMPQITAIYALLGVVPYFLYRLVVMIKNEKTLQIIEYSGLLVAFIALLVFLLTNNELTLYGKTHALDIIQKVVILVVSILPIALVVTLTYFINKKIKDNKMLNATQVVFVIFFSEFLVMFLFGSLMKAWAFGMQMFLPILISQAVIMFFDVTFNSYLLYLILRVSESALVK